MSRKIQEDCDIRCGREGLARAHSYPFVVAFKVQAAPVHPRQQCRVALAGGLSDVVVDVIDITADGKEVVVLNPTLEEVSVNAQSRRFRVSLGLGCVAIGCNRTPLYL